MYHSFINAHERLHDTMAVWAIIIKRKLQVSVVGRWDNPEKTIYHYTLSGQWSLDEFLEASEQGRQEIVDAGHPVDLILQVDGKLHIPPGFLRAIMKMHRQPPSNRRLIVVVSTDSLMNTVYKLLKTIAPRFFRDVRRVSVLEEAYAVIQAEQAPNG